MLLILLEIYYLPLVNIHRPLVVFIIPFLIGRRISSIPSSSLVSIALLPMAPMMIRPARYIATSFHDTCRERHWYWNAHRLQGQCGSIRINLSPVSIVTILTEHGKEGHEASHQNHLFLFIINTQQAPTPTPTPCRSPLLVFSLPSLKQNVGGIILRLNVITILVQVCIETLATKWTGTRSAVLRARLVLLAINKRRNDCILLLPSIKLVGRDTEATRSTARGTAFDHGPVIVVMV
mmetsp:Transcript_12836/g.28407  ORF Transcript_12836/g.28407 Transcript_12836/m.28407 type:complete len:236 (-) Transcript_12836:629-1336(-)